MFPSLWSWLTFPLGGTYVANRFEYTKNDWSWSALIAAFVLALLPRLWGWLAGGWQHYLDHAPSTYIPSVQNSPNLPPLLKQQIIRAEATLHNALETLPLFAAAILAAHLNRLPLNVLNFLCLGHLFWRLLYTLHHVPQRGTLLFPFSRTLCWLAATACLGALFLLPGQPGVESAGAGAGAPVTVNMVDAIQQLQKETTWWLSTSKLLSQEEIENQLIQSHKPQM
ncbi:hypothetical protein F5Y15DRAFT_422296 [Xylariaceae sp. FL0016]|nr:hypothetical protein F5Y15DRAFT_422296 [Xylariaceae sp. FL0016]